MELEHRFSVPLGVDEAWAAFNDLERIAPCFPGAQITSVDGDDFTGTATVKLGPISLQYSGTGRWLERDREGYRAVIEANGKDRRGNGTAGATIRARLEGDGSRTAVVLNTDLKITGRPAQFGRGVVQDVGTKLLDQFADCLTTTLGQRGTSGEAVTAPSPGEQQAEQQETVEEQAAVARQQESAAEQTVTGEQASAAQSVAGEQERAAEQATVGGPQQRAVEPGAVAGQQVSGAAPGLVAGEQEGAAEQAGAAEQEGAAEQAAVAGQQPVGQVTAAPPAPPARPTSSELDLGSVVGPVLLRQYAPMLVAVIVTAVVTWVVTRRRARSR